MPIGWNEREYAQLVKSYKGYKSLEAIKREYIAPSEKVKYQSPIFKSRLNGLPRKYGKRVEMTDRKLLEAYILFQNEGAARQDFDALS